MSACRLQKRGCDFALKLAVVCPENYFVPEVFTSDKLEYQEDRATCFIKVLKERLKGKQIELVHSDAVAPDDAWGYLFLNHNEKLLKRLERTGYKGNKFLIVFESALIQPDNWLPETRRRYTEVFSWEIPNATKESAEKAIIRYFWPNPLFLAEKPVPFSEREKLCVLMAANKWKRRPNELYTERFRAILWFMKHHPEDFDLYGYDWNISPAKKIVEHVRNAWRNMKGTQIRPIDVSPVYKGAATIKKDILKKYRFCICYENAENFPGYITEKIFDCFIAGVVPVYLGWDGVREYIPEVTFIDKRAFPTYDLLYEKLSSMGEQEYNTYLDAIRRFLVSGAAKKFYVSSFVELLLEGTGLSSISKGGVKP
jgi:hypothetical protein